MDLYGYYKYDSGLSRQMSYKYIELYEQKTFCTTSWFCNYWFPEVY